MKMVGLPTTAFDIWAGKLIAKGYKVTKVEQVRIRFVALLFAIKKAISRATLNHSRRQH